MSDIDIKKINSTIIITLTREKVLNALNLNMVREIFKNIKNWDNDKDISGVIIKGSGDKSFCAGGDIVSVYHAKSETQSILSDTFFREEYILNLAISNFSKPWISLLNGIAMGGGLGLSMHGKYRIVNNKTITAMPETAIGLFPDVGGGYFLSKMGELGLFLALTGRVMDGLDSMYSGIGTHYIENENINHIYEKIINKSNYDYIFIEQLLNANSKKLLEKDSLLYKELENIKKHFCRTNLVEIFDSLKNDNSEWTKKTLSVLSKKSPTSMSVAIKQLGLAKNITLKECLAMEFRICQAMMAKHDFYEGVRANLVDKDRNPKWHPESIFEVTEEIINSHFHSLNEKELFSDE